MKQILCVFAGAALSACSTTDLAQTTPDKIYRSARSREVVAECLLDRMTTGDNRMNKETVDGITTVSMTSGIARVAVFLFTIRDDGNGGSITELRRFNKIALGQHNAETCF